MTSHLDPTTLRAVNEAATPGPWEVDTTLEVNASETDPNVPDRWFTWELSAGGEAMLGGTELDNPVENLAHIATFDPPTIQKLLDVLDAALIVVPAMELGILGVDAGGPTKAGVWKELVAALAPFTKEVHL